MPQTVLLSALLLGGQAREQRLGVDAPDTRLSLHPENSPLVVLPKATGVRLRPVEVTHLTEGRKDPSGTRTQPGAGGLTPFCSHLCTFTRGREGNELFLCEPVTPVLMRDSLPIL